MCGIAGIWQLDGAPVELARLRAMTAAMAHRGPDDEGYVALDPAGAAPPCTAGGPRTAAGARAVDVPYAAPAVGADPGDRSLVLGQVRLAIIDLSPRGHQPMCNEDGSIWLTFGGEIYNYRELRDSLDGRGHRFRSATDTEVVVHGYEEWGEDVFDRLNGMWGLALWDARRRVLIAARDRLGIKPFYFVHDAGRFAFASEIRPLLGLEAAGGRRPAPNDRAITSLIARAQVDTTDETFFAGVRALGPGHYLVLGRGGLAMRRYWDLTPAEDPEAAAAVPAATWAERLREALAESVRLRLRADVPVGTCLSGGLDSSSVLALGSRELGQPMDAYSVAYAGEGAAFDERPYMQAVVRASGARHHLVVPGAEALFERLRRVVRAQEEPAAGPGILSQWHVMELAAANDARVLLDGQGGDELFGGYFAFYYPLVMRDLLRAGRPGAALAVAGRARTAGHRPLEIAGRLAEPLLPARLYAFLRRRLGSGGGGDRLLAADYRRAHRLPAPAAPRRFQDRLTSRLYWDLSRDILPSLLRYEDRNAMAFSIEARVPFLDLRVVELAFRMPGRVKAAGGLTKQVLRQAMRGIVPDAVLARTDKRGYETPVTRWLARQHAAALDALLLDGRAVARGMLDRRRTRERLRRFAAGEPGPAHDLWRLLNLELWLRAFFDGAGEGT